jgi:opacity protein-like surface antigen
MPARSAQGEPTRYYAAIRFAESNPLSSAHDAAGGAIGAEFGRHLSFELSVDSYELFLDTPNHDKVGEVSLLGVVPQIRLRYPLLADRLIPYAVAGAGIGVTQVNDRKLPIAWRGGETDVRPVGTVGLGLEYLFTHDIAFGLEAKYVIAGSGTFSVGDEREDVDLDAALLTFGLRLLFPEGHPSTPDAISRERPTRFYLAARTGASLLVDGEPFAGVTTSTEQPIFGSDLNLLFGGAVGVNFGRHLGVELSIEQHEYSLSAPGVGGLGEYSVFPILLQPRLRYPLHGGRLEPYVLAGVGLELAEVNDRISQRTLKVSGGDQTFIGAVGAGLEYFISSDISISGECKYVISRAHEIRVGDSTARGTLDSVFLSIGLRAYLVSL